MTDLDKYTAVWGEDSLVCFPADFLEDLSIPKDAKKFLREIGLPLRSQMPLGSCFVPLSVAAARKEQTSEPTLLSSFPSLPCRAFGFIDYDFEFGRNTYFCINEKQGTVHPYDTQDPALLLVNSSLPCFVDALLCFHAYLDVEAAHPGKRNERILLKQLKQALRTIDEPVFKRRNSYWSVMLADLAVQI